MLPFFDSKKLSGAVLMRQKKPSVELASEQIEPEGEDDPMMRSLATDMLSAIQEKSVIKLSAALQAIFRHLETQPHEEFDMDDDEGSYE
jgi:hypothetical protein